ncbi:MAG TPA: patatin-like phospholipase family protein [Pyrinomonadaceae bacterium]|nr:patatin-like phospholipase family protein [Pyrinomonadaceae bacterium]
MTTNYNIIACDGGGIRGLITAMLLNDLVSNPPSGFNSNILTNVNLYAGTSTGGIIAIGLACGLTPSSLVTLYGSDCSSIFQRYQPSAASSLLSRLGLPHLSLDPCSWVHELCYVKYSNEGLHNALSNTLTSAHVNPDSPLSQLSTGVLAVTMMLSNTRNDPWGPLALTNLPNSDYANVAIIDAAMCSSAAPLYFPPYAVPPLPATPTMWCADGGVVANNPSAFTLAHVLESQVLQQENKQLSNVMMLSIGTGSTIDYIPSMFLSSFVNDWGMLNWLNPIAVPPEPIFPLMAAMFDGQAQIAHIEAGNILGNSQYQRANPTLTQTINLDDCGAITELESVANAYIKSTEWANIKQWAYKNFV